MTRIIHILAACTFASLLLASFISPASAGLKVVGVTFDAVVSPGEAFEHEIMVSTRDTDDPMDIETDVFGYAQESKGAIIALDKDQDTGKYTARDFVDVSPKSFHLNPGESKKVIVSGNMPLNAGDGGRYALVNIRTHPMGNGSIGIALAANIPVRLTIAGSKLIETGKIQNAEISKQDLLDNHSISAVFQNTGNHHYMAFANLVIKNENGDQAINATTPLSNNPIIPAYSTSFLIPVDKDLAAGTYVADISVVHENGTVLDTAEKTFKV